MKEVTQLHFYGSGCLKPEGAAIVHHFLRSLFEADIFVYSDLEGAAISTLGNRPGIAAILGTGSSAALWDGSSISKTSPSLGYILGDEGSGTDIAKHLLQDILYKEVEEEIRLRFFEKYNTSPAEIISRLYSHPEPAAYLAGYCRFLSENIAHPYCIQLLQKRFAAFIQKHLIPLGKEHTSTVGFNGGIAYAFQEVLKTALREAGFIDISFLKTPIEALVQFHKNEKGW
jgi:N-acetylglucosamine kinase-like BadF-type ATPase